MSQRRGDERFCRGSLRGVSESVPPALPKPRFLASGSFSEAEQCGSGSKGVSPLGEQCLHARGVLFTVRGRSTASLGAARCRLLLSSVPRGTAGYPVVPVLRCTPWCPDFCRCHELMLAILPAIPRAPGSLVRHPARLPWPHRAAWGSPRDARVRCSCSVALPHRAEVPTCLASGRTSPSRGAHSPALSRSQNRVPPPVLARAPGSLAGFPARPPWLRRAAWSLTRVLA